MILAEASYGPYYSDNGRYLLRLPGEPKVKQRTRMTTFIKAVDDAQNLIPWSMVMALQGVFGPSPAGIALRAQFAALLARSSNPYYDSETSKAEAKQIAEAAKEAGGGGARRDVGTALHDMTEAVITGKSTIDQVDAEWRPKVSAILHALDAAGWDVVVELCERAVHNATYDVVGRFDLMLRARHDITVSDTISIPAGTMVIGDLKTGGELWKPKKDWKTKQQVGWIDAHTDSDLTESMQLAGYAGAAVVIEWPADQWAECATTAMPEVSQQWGVIIHAPSSGAEVVLRYLDLAIGRQGLAVCAQVREARKLHPLLGRVGPDTPAWPPCEQPSLLADTATPEPVVEAPAVDVAALRAWLTGRVDSLRDAEAAMADLAKRWPATVPTLKRSEAHTLEQLRAIEKVLDRVEADHGRPFGEPDPTFPPPAPNPLVDNLPTDPEGPVVADAVLDELTGAMQALVPTSRLSLNAWNMEAKECRVPVQVLQRRTERRVWILRALLAWAQVEDEDVARVALDLVAPVTAPTPTGGRFGALTLPDARRMAELGAAFLAGEITLTVNPDSAPTLSGPPVDALRAAA